MYRGNRQVITKGHPDDVRNQNEAIAEAEARIEKFIEKNYNRLGDLILTYADDDAAKWLAILREEFWSSIP